MSNFEYIIPQNNDLNDFLKNAYISSCYTDVEIIKYSKEKKGIVIVPVAFVSEHSETLVELDIEYKKLAEENGCSFYKRVPALGIEENFINGLMELVLKQDMRGKFVSSVICPGNYKKCPCLGLKN